MVPQLTGCQYLRACIDETLRISPPVPGTLWREISSDHNAEPVIIDGYAIPKGILFGVNTYALHHNEEYFPDPFSFQPERWLPEYTSEAQINLMRGAFASFSLGSRGCAGKSMAYLEASLVIAKTMWYFDFEVAPGSAGDLGLGEISRQDVDGSNRKEYEYHLDDIFTAAHDGPNLAFFAREGVAQEQS